MNRETPKVSDMKIGFTNNDITAYGDAVLFLKMTETCGFDEALKTAKLPRQGSNRGHNPILIFKTFMAGLWEGASCFEHMEKVRYDPTVCNILGKEEGIGYRAILRYLNKFDQTTNRSVFGYLYNWLYEQLSFNNFTLDFDSTAIVGEGNQDGVAKGYYPKRTGRLFHPLLAFVADQRFIANYWLRPNTAVPNNYTEFLDGTLSHLGEKKVKLVRMDSGFYSCEVLDNLEGKGLDYIIACRFSTGIKRSLVLENEWKPTGKGIDMAETEYLGTGYTSPRRIVMVRENPEERPESAGKKIIVVRKGENEKPKRGWRYRTCDTSNQIVVQLNLFPEIEADEYKIAEIQKYRYSCFVTSLADDAETVCDKYRGRADCENRIKELKYGFSLDKFVTQDFWATEACGNIVILAYNLFSLFRQALVNSSKEEE